MFSRTGRALDDACGAFRCYFLTAMILLGLYLAASAIYNLEQA